MNAAYDEFAEYGYHNASTNRIIKNAGISKGLLFYYFNSKKELYQDLFDSAQVVVEAYLSKMDSVTPDFIERYVQLRNYKFKAITENPHVFRFLASLYLHDDYSELNEESVKKMEEMTKTRRMRLNQDIDMSKLRNNITEEWAKKIVDWCMSGYEKALTDELKKSKASEGFLQENLWREYDELLSVLKILFYKDEEDRT